MNIYGKTNITYTHAQAYAKSKKASNVFINNAKIYWEVCNKVGINPCIAYCQYAVETGWGKFGGVLNESYCNPCGLKNSVGGSCTDPNAHKKFASWKDGIEAHIDHLALYAGVKGYPKKDTKDPRHFSYLLGKAKTVEGLSGAWATGNTYANKIIKLVKELETYKISTTTNTTNEVTNSSSKEEFLDGKNFKVRITTAILNIRKSSSFTSPIAGTVKKNQVFTITEVINGLGRLKSGVGFISMNTNYVEKVKNTPSINNNINKSKDYKGRVVNCTYVNARKGPGTNYAVATVVKAGTILTIVDESYGWLKTKSGTYIYKDYIKKV